MKAKRLKEIRERCFDAHAAYVEIERLSSQAPLPMRYSLIPPKDATGGAEDAAKIWMVAGPDGTFVGEVVFDDFPNDFAALSGAGEDESQAPLQIKCDECGVTDQVVSLCQKCCFDTDQESIRSDNAYVQELLDRIAKLEAPLQVSDEMRERVARALAAQDLMERGMDTEGAVYHAWIDNHWRDWLDSADVAIETALATPRGET